ncbi:hypothetical protein [Paenibacillus sp. DMB20]|nr:hypothetical protein [Paenibacillus sp. DMB20]
MKENMMNALLVALHETEGVGWKTIERIMVAGLKRGNGSLYGE